MEKSRNSSLVARYGKVNIGIAVTCAIFLLINSIIVSETALYQIASNKYTAYLLNFLAGCEGKIGTIGSMSKAKVFIDGEWWRLFLHMYLHAGVLHMLFNVLALLFVGKAVEKKMGSLPYFLLYHAIVVVNAIIMCLIFPESVSVGASAGIFGMIGIVCVMKWKKGIVSIENLKKNEIIYIILFSVLSLLLGLESLVTHFIAFVLGIIAGLCMIKVYK